MVVGKAKKYQSSNWVSNNQFRPPLFVAPFTSALLLLLPKRDGPPHIWNHYNFTFRGHDVSNHSILTVRELNWNFSYLNLFLIAIHGFCSQGADRQALASRPNLPNCLLLTVALSSFFNIYIYIYIYIYLLFSYWSKQDTSDLFLLNPFSSIFTPYNAQSSFF